MSDDVMQIKLNSGPNCEIKTSKFPWWDFGSRIPEIHSWTRLFLRFGIREHQKFYEAAIFIKTYKNIRTRIVYYSIDNYSTQSVYYCIYKNYDTNVSISTLLNSYCPSVKASVSYSSYADSRVFSARCVTLRLLFASIHFNHTFHEQSQPCPHH